MTDKRHQRVIDYLNSRGKSPVRLWGWSILGVILGLIILAMFGKTFFEYFESLNPLTQAVLVIIICGLQGIFVLIKIVKR